MQNLGQNTDLQNVFIGCNPLNTLDSYDTVYPCAGLMMSVWPPYLRSAFKFPATVTELMILHT